jgi:2-keto-4-pentenoate hydratase/2-oxohepta-3-ene-1,7-dioic acid hydratase in catechol pathway
MRLPADRRSLLEKTTTLGLGALAGCAIPGLAQIGIKTSLAVPSTNIPIVGADQIFQARRVCLFGRNDAANAREIGSDPTSEPPGTIANHPFPTLTRNDHDEVELGAPLNRGGHNVAMVLAMDHVHAYAIGLNMLRCDLQGPMQSQPQRFCLRCSCRSTKAAIAAFDSGVAATLQKFSTAAATPRR